MFRKWKLNAVSLKVALLNTGQASGAVAHIVLYHDTVLNTASQYVISYIAIVPIQLRANARIEVSRSPPVQTALVDPVSISLAHRVLTLPVL